MPETRKVGIKICLFPYLAICFALEKNVMYSKLGFSVIALDCYTNKQLYSSVWI